ncbi:MAG: hypothetical protein IPM51_06990 [Sphingobacteriaceae bacterium]|nr:hypothetical protein [Sphingobacteriaceae bacterium]
MRTRICIMLATLILTIIITTSFKAGGEAPKYATIRVVEAGTVISGSGRIIIIYEGKSEDIPLDKPTPNNSAVIATKINKAINELAGKGYELVTQSGGDYVTTYTLIKK